MLNTVNVALSGKVAVVTGGGTGIGKAISEGLAANGAAVVVNYSKSRADAEQTVAQITAEGGRAIAAQADVTDEAQVEGLINLAVSEFGGLDGLPEDCVGAVLLFVSEAGSFITGQILEINGGMAMP
jgi:NAD(P)-dependent dehydrogenase (short-subunit alcohol dehydrogenase family)